MKYPLTIFFFILLFASGNCCGQDTSKYCQSKSIYVSNCYVFYKPDKTQNKGFFEKFMDADDGQRWYGKGNFIETKSRIILDQFRLFRTMYSYSGGQFIKDDSINDSSIVKRQIFYKKGNALIELYKEVKFQEKKTKIIYSKQ